MNLMERLRRRPTAEESAEADRLAALAQDGDEGEEEEEEAAAESAQDGDEGDEEEEEAAAESAQDGDEEDEEDEEPMGEEDENAKAARRRERARIAAIVRSDAAKGRQEAALAFALDTDLTPKEAAAVLEKTPKGSAKGRLAEAMDTVPQPAIGPGGGDAAADTMDAAAARLAGYVNAPRA